VTHPIRSEHRCPPSTNTVLLYWALALIVVSVVLYIALTH
jgi:predicted nucleic acid-binding Zn ribbon protein